MQPKKRHVVFREWQRKKIRVLFLSRRASFDALDEGIFVGFRVALNLAGRYTFASAKSFDFSFNIIKNIYIYIFSRRGTTELRVDGSLPETTSSLPHHIFLFR